MKIYMLIADNGWSYEEHRWWNVKAFTSEETAREYIQKLPSIIEENEKRIDELDMLLDVREWTDSEKKEHDELCDRWGCYWHFFDYGYFKIEEYELQE